jgi:hypothetical protein
MPLSYKGRVSLVFAFMFAPLQMSMKKNYSLPKTKEKANRTSSNLPGKFSVLY